MNMGTPHTSRNQGKILKFHGIERVKNRCTNKDEYYELSQLSSFSVLLFTSSSLF